VTSSPPPGSGIGSKKRRDHFVRGFRAVKCRRHITCELTTTAAVRSRP
jgi:hypothetical protein